MYQIGCIIGSFIFGVLAYYFGRRAIFMVKIFIYLDYVVYICDWSYIVFDGERFSTIIVGQVFNWS